MSKPRLFPLAFAPLCLALLAPAAAPAQDAAPGPLRVEITGGLIEPVPLALPAFFGSGDLPARLGQVVTDDLTGTGLFRALPEADLPRPDSFDAAISYEGWKASAAQALVLGAVTQEGDQVTARFRLYDVFAGQPMGEGLQFTAAEADWRRLAHKIADAVYSRLTGEGPYFDSRVAFVGEDGPKEARRKRIGIMDTDGANLKWLTDDAALVMSPRFSPDGTQLIYTSYASGFPQLRLLDVATVEGRDLPVKPGTMSFAGRFSPDGTQIVFTQDQNGNSDLYAMALEGGALTQLTHSPAIETGASFSPDGTQIAFESDRSGSPQLYVMNAQGGEARRISFGAGAYGAPAWSPKGDLIAFAKREGGQFHIGVMGVDGGDERILTSSFLDEAPEWAPNGRVVMFTRQTPGETGVTRLHSVDMTGRNMRPIEMEGTASDPAWSPLLP